MSTPVAIATARCMDFTGFSSLRWRCRVVRVLNFGLRKGLTCLQ